MPWTYEGAPFAETPPVSTQVIIDSVRFLIGDTDTTDRQLLDGEISGLYNNNNADVYQAAIEAARALVAKYTRQVNKTIGNASVEAASRAAQYRALVPVLQAASLRHGGAPHPYAGGISRSDQETDTDNSDRVPMDFEIGMHDDHGSTSDINSGTGFTQVVPG